MKHYPPSSRSGERGAIVIVVVLVLLSVMTVAALAVGSNSFREIAITGNESTGRKASEAADAGLDWTIAWANPDALGIATAGAEKAIQDAMGQLLDAVGSEDPGMRPTGTDPLPSSDGKDKYIDYGMLNTDTGSLRLFLRSKDKDYAGSSLFLAKKGDTGFLQDSVIQQSFDIEIRYLGASLTPSGSGSKVKKQGTLFLVRTVGRANIGTIGTTGQSFISQREALLDYTPQ